MSYPLGVGSLLRPPHSSLGQYDVELSPGEEIPTVSLGLTYEPLDVSPELAYPFPGYAPSARDVALWLGLLVGVYVLAQRFGGRI